MKQLMLKISVTLITILLFTSLLNLSLASNSSRSDPIGEEYIQEIQSEAKDENNDTIYDVLELRMKIDIPASDTYLIFAAMTPHIPAKDSINENFEAGVHEVILTFDGDVIYESGRDGPYTIEVSVYKGYGETLVEIEHITEYYNHETFNPAPITESAGVVTVENNTIKLETTTFSAVIYMRTPMIVFYYNSDEGQTGKFKINYENIICFDDQNGDDKFQGNELKYWGDLLNSGWNVPIILMEDFNNFDFQVQTIVELIDVNHNSIGTNIELVFHYSSVTKSEDIESARKFDISMNILGQPIDGVTHIALEHRLEDEMANHDFLQGGNKISFMTYDGKEHGYYSWKPNVEVTTSTGGFSKKSVTYNLEETTEGTQMMLYLNYPYSMDNRNLFHDPVVGVNPDHEPPPPGITPPVTISHEQWLIIYVLVAVVVAAVMIGNIYRQTKKRK